jgi:hypothetical protein
MRQITGYLAMFLIVVLGLLIYDAVVKKVFFKQTK